MRNKTVQDEIYQRIEKMNYQLVETDNKHYWHFRKDPTNIMESFTILYSHDGTISITGDYGVLGVRANYFPKTMRKAIFWLTKETDVRYFAQKVQIRNSNNCIIAWDKEIAGKQIEECLMDSEPEHLMTLIKGSKPTFDKEFEEMSDEEYKKAHSEITKFILENEIDGYWSQHEMSNAVMDFFDCGTDILEHEFGEIYTGDFNWQFGLLRFWGETMKENDYQQPLGIHELLQEAWKICSMMKCWMPHLYRSADPSIENWVILVKDGVSRNIIMEAGGETPEKALQNFIEIARKEWGDDETILKQFIVDMLHYHYETEASAKEVAWERLLKESEVITWLGQDGSEDKLKEMFKKEWQEAMAKAGE